MTGSRRRIVGALAIVFLMSSLAAVSLIMGSGGFDRRATIDEWKTPLLGDVRLISVRSEVGDVSILPGSGDMVIAHLHGEHSGREIRLVAEERSGVLRIRADQKPSVLMMRFGRVDLDVTVPERFARSLEVVSSAGDIKIENVKAQDIDIQDSAGDIRLGTLVCSGRLTLRNSAGSIRADSLKCGDLTIDSSAGEIEVNALEARTANVRNSAASTRLLGVRSTDLRANSSAGSFYVEYASFDNDIRVANSGGDISVKLPRGSSFKLYAKSSGGRVRCELPITPDGRAGGFSGIVGDSSTRNQVRLDSSGGDVVILR